MVTVKEQPFYEVPIKSNLNEALSVLSVQLNDWEEYYNFEAVRVPTEFVTSNCKFLDRLNKAHPFHCGILKMKPNTFYDWHIDTNRGASINMQLGLPKTLCMFQDGDRINNMVGNFTTLNYSIDTYFVFNNQVPHTVYNFDRIRYLFSLEFEEDKNKLIYNQLVKEIKSW